MVKTNLIYLAEYWVMYEALFFIKYCYMFSNTHKMKFLLNSKGTRFLLFVNHGKIWKIYSDSYINTLHGHMQFLLVFFPAVLKHVCTYMALKLAAGTPWMLQVGGHTLNYIDSLK